MNAREIIQVAAWALFAAAFIVSVWSITTSVRGAFAAMRKLEREERIRQALERITTDEHQ